MTYCLAAEMLVRLLGISDRLSGREDRIVVLPLRFAKYTVGEL